MKLKYYLRGLGIGIVVTAIILTIALERKPQALTDAEIKAKAAELGMVENKPGSDNQTTGAAVDKKEPVPVEAAGQTEPTSKATEPATKATEPTSKATEPKTEPTKASSEKTTAPTTKATEPESSNNHEGGTYITIDIAPSDFSNHAASKLQAAGLVENAADFDRYLIDHGYESRIASGRHEFKVGSTYQELAEELVKNRK